MIGHLKRYSGQLHDDLVHIRDYRANAETHILSYRAELEKLDVIIKKFESDLKTLNTTIKAIEDPAQPSPPEPSDDPPEWTPAKANGIEDITDANIASVNLTKRIVLPEDMEKVFAD